MASDDKAFSHESAFVRFINLCVQALEKPVIWFRENVVVPNRREYYWYHEKIRRVPTVDECYTDDAVCIYEAEKQFQRDRRVEENIVKILRKRYMFCKYENAYEMEVCQDLHDIYFKAINNFFIKYGDLGIKSNAINCLIKQKNRMAWERRHGPVGSGRKPPPEGNY